MGMCPRTEDLLARSVGIAVGPTYTEDDVSDLAAAVRKVVTQLL